ncbi:MAG: hypothetical protein AMJ88_04875 [Anaerolineae bacterium SM23_ 63]|nr:MAG: hypothetical protein AMJ88_04875 [Anaerolineae bacterium SM23_ 63]
MTVLLPYLLLNIMDLFSDFFHPHQWILIQDSNHFPRCPSNSTSLPYLGYLDRYRIAYVVAIGEHFVKCILGLLMLFQSSFNAY